MTNPITVSERPNSLKKAYFHFMALWGLAMMLMLNWPEGYRAFIYLNLVVVVAHLFSHSRDQVLRTRIIAIAAIPIILTMLHMLAIGKFELVKEVRHIWLATFTVVSVLILARRNVISIRSWIPISIILLLVIYCLAQIISLTVFNKHYGTSRNPHYLALYASLGLPLAIYCAFTMRNWYRYIMVPVAGLLGYFVLHASSRPAWLALILTALGMLFFIKNKNRYTTLLLILVIPLVLFFTNLAGFGDRVSDLAKNISTEERVAIWREAWKMQTASEVRQWFWGHGLDSYEDDFKNYFKHERGVYFHSPHNSFLEILYTSGIAGLMACVWLYYWIYSRLWRMAKDASSQGRVAVLLISIATINFLFIMLTIPFISHYNIYTLAFVIGMIFYLKENSARRPDEA